jgi:hypothetical protein
MTNGSAHAIPGPHPQDVRVLSALYRHQASRSEGR